MRLWVALIRGSVSEGKIFKREAMRYISTQRITRLCAMAAATVLAAGCAVNQPNVAGMAASVTPEGWSNAPLPFGAPVVFKDFWQRWNDPGLVAVVERAIAANPDVLTAAAEQTPNGAEEYAVTVPLAPYIEYYEIAADSTLPVGHNIYDAPRRRKLAIEKYPWYGYETERPKTIPVTIGSDNWIGKNATLMKGTIIGNRCIVGYATILCKLHVPDNKTVVQSIEIKEFPNSI